jgi:hypothetical protein
MTEERKAELYTSPGGKFVRADTLPRLLAHWRSFRAEQKRKHLIKYDGVLYAGNEVNRLQTQRLKAEVQVSTPSMLQSNIPKKRPFADVPCPRCQKTMAFERLYYAVNEVASIGYKCLSCGYEETRPGTLPQLPE